MPATPSQLRRPVVVNHTIDFEGAPVKFVYDRNKITDAWIKEWGEFEENSEGSKMNELLDDLLVSWDVINEDGTPYPKTPENIGYLFAIPLKGRIFWELVEAAIPSRAEGNASPKHSSTSDSSGMTQATSPPQNGPVPSPSPAPSASPSPT